MVRPADIMIGDVTLLGDPVNVGSAGTPYATDGAWPISVPEVANHKDRVGVQGVPNDGWWDGATANQKYIVANYGGQPNNRRGLGWTTGLGIRRFASSPITGKTLIPPRTQVNPQVGPVGFSTSGAFTAAGVASQTAVLPTPQQIAASFLRPDLTAIIANGGY
jgi:hypothetical protein